MFITVMGTIRLSVCVYKIADACEVQSRVHDPLELELPIDDVSILMWVLATELRHSGKP